MQRSLLQMGEGVWDRAQGREGGWVQRAVYTKELRWDREAGSQPLESGVKQQIKVHSVTCCYAAVGKFLGCLEPWFPHLFSPPVLHGGEYLQGMERTNRVQVLHKQELFLVGRIHVLRESTCLEDRRAQLPKGTHHFSAAK